jgi:hypothetical protein
LTHRRRAGDQSTESNFSSVRSCNLIRSQWSCYCLAWSEFIQPRQRVTLCEQVDGTLREFAGEMELSWSSTRRGCEITSSIVPGFTAISPRNTAKRGSYFVSVAMMSSRQATMLWKCDKISIIFL